MKRVIPFFVLQCLALVVFSQEAVRGIIKDGGGLPIPGANVIIKGTQRYAISEIDGTFSLTAVKLPFTVLISSIGYQPQEIEFYELAGDQFEITLRDENVLPEIVVTSRRREEAVQQVPIPISVLGGSLIEETGAFNVNRIKELVPTVQLYSSNPRNTTLNIRGLGSTFGLTNDGIEPGVGFYVDGVYYARPAATSLDFVDVEQIEVLRGPQGTLFGKNTTAGSFNITTRSASFIPGTSLEVSYGKQGYLQAKSSVTGPLVKDKLAVRVSFSGTQRDGTIHNLATDEYVNDLNNLGIRGQLLFIPADKLRLTLAADATRQRPNGYAQVIAGVAPTLRADFRQFNNIIADLGYALPSQNAFDRLIDHDIPWRSLNDLGGVSLNAEFKMGKGTVTSTSALRYWIWNPSSDRDFTGLPVLTLSQAPSKHKNWSQEVRYSGDFSSKLSGVVGVFLLGQTLRSDPYHTEQAGAAQWRFSQRSTDPLWQTPGLLDGYGIRTYSALNSFSAAAFANLDWAIIEHLHVMPGIRYNYDTKDADYRRETYGGLETDDPALLAIKRTVYSNQAFTADVRDRNFSGQVTLAFTPGRRMDAFATYSRSYKPAGVNLSGLPTSDGEVMTEPAQIKPESVQHLEIGVKTSPTSRSTVNFAVYNTDVSDYQTLVQNAQLGVNRGYLANADKVRVTGAELDATLRVRYFSFYGSAAYTDGRYVSFTNAPVPLEETGGESAYKDISGGRLPGISRVAGSFGGEYLSKMKNIFGQSAKFFVAFDVFYRSSFSSSPSPSRYLNIDGYALLNARAGFRALDGLSVSVWGRNVLDQEYYEQLLPAAGNAGHYAAVLGDPINYGVTLRFVR